MTSCGREKMFAKPLSEIEYNDVGKLCKERIPEGIAIDYKKDFPKDLAKVMASFANTMGGYILIGVEEEQDHTPKLPIKGVPASKQNTERINQTGLYGVYPPILPGVKECPFDSGKKAIIVIQVNESLSAPHIDTHSNKIPIRVADVTDPIQVADIERLEYLFRRRDPAREQRERIVERSRQRFQFLTRGALGVQAVRSVIIGPLFPHQPKCSAEEASRIASAASRDTLIADLESPIQDGAMLVRGEGQREGKADDYTELNQNGIIIHRSLLSVDKEEYGITNMIDYGWTLCTLVNVAKFACKSYKKMGFWGMVGLEISLDDIQGYRLGLASRTPSEACVDKFVRISDQVSVSTLVADPAPTLSRLAERLIRCFGVSWVSREDISKGVDSRLSEVAWYDPTSWNC